MQYFFTELEYFVLNWTNLIRLENFCTQNPRVIHGIFTAPLIEITPLNLNQQLPTNVVCNIFLQNLNILMRTGDIYGSFSGM